TGDDNTDVSATSTAGGTTAAVAVAPAVPSPRTAAAQAPPTPAEQAAVALSLVGHTDLGGRGFTANVRVLGSFAYVGSWGAARCPAQGVRIVDFTDPGHPTVVASAAVFPGTSA